MDRDVDVRTAREGTQPATAAAALRPRSPEAELLLLQSRVGNRGVTALMRRVLDEPDFMAPGQRVWSPAWGATPPVAPPDPLDPERLADALDVTTPQALRDRWASIEASIVVRPRLTALRVPAVATALAALDRPAREKLAHRVQDVLIARLGGGTITGDIVDAELAAIGPRAATWCGGRSGWLLVRAGVLDAFGTLAAARRYYDQDIVDYTFFGLRAPVHRDMAAALEVGRAKFVAMGGDPSKVRLRSFGGVNIRPNTNAPWRLSEHSFGAAVDIDGETQTGVGGAAAGNPNVSESSLAKQGIPDFWGFVAEVAGGDVFQRDAKGRRVRNSTSGHTAKENTEEATRLAGISARLRGVFASEAAVKQAMRELAERHGVPVPPKGEDALYTAASAAAAAKTKAARKAAEQALLDVVQGFFNAPGTQGPADPAVARRLIELALAFRLSGNEPGAGVPVPNAEAIGTIGSIAAHGFLNLDPLLIGALSGSDGGKLVWLGATGGTRDSMHFELPDRPDLHKQTPAP